MRRALPRLLLTALLIVAFAGLALADPLPVGSFNAGRGTVQLSPTQTFTLGGPGVPLDVTFRLADGNRVKTIGIIGEQDLLSLSDGTDFGSLRRVGVTRIDVVSRVNGVAASLTPVDDRRPPARSAVVTTVVAGGNRAIPLKAGVLAGTEGPVMVAFEDESGVPLENPVPGHIEKASGIASGSRLYFPVKAEPAGRPLRFSVRGIEDSSASGVWLRAVAVSTTSVRPGTSQDLRLTDLSQPSAMVKDAAQHPATPRRPPEPIRRPPAPSAEAPVRPAVVSSGVPAAFRGPLEKLRVLLFVSTDTAAVSSTGQLVALLNDRHAGEEFRKVLGAARTSFPDPQAAELLHNRHSDYWQALRLLRRAGFDEATARFLPGGHVSLRDLQQVWRLLNNMWA